MFKTVSRHLQFVEDVVASVVTLVEEVAEKVARRVRRFLPAGEKAGAAEISAALRAVAHIIDGEAAELRTAERKHSQELRKERTLRKRRKRDAATLYRKLLKVRKTLESFGRGMAALAVGLDLKLLTASPDVLARYGREAVGVLSKPDFTLPAHALDAGTFDARQHAEDVLPALRQFEKTDAELKDQIKETQEACRVKQACLERFKKGYRYGKWVIEGFYGLAGAEFHLERLEPKLGTRKGKKEEPASETDAEATEQSTADDDASDRAPGGEP